MALLRIKIHWSNTTEIDTILRNNISNLIYIYAVFSLLGCALSILGLLPVWHFWEAKKKRRTPLIKNILVPKCSWKEDSNNACI